MSAARRFGVSTMDRSLTAGRGGVSAGIHRAPLIRGLPLSIVLIMTAPAGFAPHVESIVPPNARGANVLCLHGIFAGAWMFESLLPMIASRGYPAHAVSYRGHLPNPALPDIGKLSIASYV